MHVSTVSLHWFASEPKVQGGFTPKKTPPWDMFGAFLHLSWVTRYLVVEYLANEEVGHQAREEEEGMANVFPINTSRESKQVVASALSLPEEPME